MLSVLIDSLDDLVDTHNQRLVCPRHHSLAHVHHDVHPERRPISPQHAHCQHGADLMVGADHWEHGDIRQVSCGKYTKKTKLSIHYGAN